MIATGEPSMANASAAPISNAANTKRTGLRAVHASLLHSMPKCSTHSIIGKIKNGMKSKCP